MIAAFILFSLFAIGGFVWIVSSVVLISFGRIGLIEYYVLSHGPNPKEVLRNRAEVGKRCAKFGLKLFLSGPILVLVFLALWYIALFYI